MWSDWLVFCDYGFSVSVLWRPLTTPTVFLGSLLPWMWGISSWLLQQSTATAPYLGWGVSPHSHPSWPWRWSSSSQFSWACTTAETFQENKNIIPLSGMQFTLLCSRVKISFSTPPPPHIKKKTNKKTAVLYKTSVSHCGGSSFKCIPWHVWWHLDLTKLRLWELICDKLM